MVPTRLEEAAEAGRFRNLNGPKTTVLNSLTSVSGQRTTGHAIRAIQLSGCDRPSDHPFLASLKGCCTASPP